MVVWLFGQLWSLERIERTDKFIGMLQGTDACNMMSQHDGFLVECLKIVCLQLWEVGVGDIHNGLVFVCFFLIL